MFNYCIKAEHCTAVCHSVPTEGRERNLYKIALQRKIEIHLSISILQNRISYFYTMKRDILCIALSAILIATSCNNKPAASAGQGDKDAAQNEYYPIGGFIQSQLKKLDSLPLAIIKYTTVNNTTDTAITDKKDFAAIAGYFASPDISSAGIKNQYEETSLIDASLGTIIFIYTAKNDTAPLRKADVLLSQEDTKVKTLYIEKNKISADSVIAQKMLWTADRSCQVTTIQHPKGSPEKVIVERYVWDDRP